MATSISVYYYGGPGMFHNFPHSVNRPEWEERDNFTRGIRTFLYKTATTASDDSLIKDT